MNRLKTHDEVQAAAAAYEAESGNCCDCKGTGKEWCGWYWKDRKRNSYDSRLTP